MSIEKNRFYITAAVYIAAALILVAGCATTAPVPQKASTPKQNTELIKGQTELARNNLHAALELFNMASQNEPNNWYIYNRMGWTCLRLKQYEKAIVQFNKANNLKEEYGSHLGLAEAYSESGHSGFADISYAKSLDMASTDIQKNEVKLSWAGRYLERGDSRNAYMLLGPVPYLGLNIRESEEGMTIEQVRKNSPADFAGLQKGDILTGFNGKSLKGVKPYQFVTEILGIEQYGSEAQILVKRDESFLPGKIVIGIVPESAGIGIKKEPVIGATAQDRPRPAVALDGQAKNLLDDFFNSPGRQSAPAKMEEKPTGIMPKTKPPEALEILSARWAVIIGISSYQDTQIPTLRYASSDARAFHDWIVSPDGGKYAPSRVRLLLNEQATGANIKMALFEWLREAIEEDMVVIYFAGHGSPESPENPNNLYLLPYDTRYGSIATTGFPMWDIETALKRFIKARKVVVLADACHSGGVGQSFDIARRANRGVRINPISSGIQNLSQIGDGICVISASTENQFSQESAEWGGGHGVFTHFLLEALKGNADYNRDLLVSLGELSSYLSEQVRRSTRNAQSPTVSGRYDPALTLGK